MATNNATNTSNPITVAQGGTGDNTLTTAYGTLCAGTTATGPIQTVSPGTSGQALVSAGAAALPAYGTLGVNGGGTGRTTSTTAYGTICAGTTATSALQTVSPGTTGQALVSGGASALPAYGTLPVTGGGTGVATLTTAYGTLCAGTTATGTVQTVSPGTAGWVLTSNGASALPTYQAAAGGSSGFTFLSAVTASNSATVNFDNLFTSTYEMYEIRFENVVAVSSGNLLCQFGTGGTPTYQTSSYRGIGLMEYDSGGATVGPSAYLTGTTSMQLSGSNLDVNVYIGTTAINSATGVVSIANVNSSTSHKQIIGDMGYTSTVNYIIRTSCACVWQSTTAVTSIRLLMNTGNITTGNFYLYGLQKV